MKKILVVIGLFCSVSLNAQNVQSHKNFFSDVQYNFSVGIALSQCDKEYDVQKFFLAVGIDAQKPILHFLNEKSTIYGLIGLHYDTRGGKNTSDFIEALEDENASISASYLKIPLRVGLNYQFKRFSLFIDLGPYLSAKVSDGDNEYVEMASSEFGCGTTLGIKFKSFAFSIGMDKGLTNFATMMDDELKMKNTTSHVDFRWSF